MLKSIDSNALEAIASRARDFLAALADLETKQATPDTPLSPTISQAEFSVNTGLGINRVNQLVRAGRIKHVKLGARNVRIPRAELTEFFERESTGGQK